MFNILDKVIAKRLIKKTKDLVTCLKVGYHDNVNASYYQEDLLFYSTRLEQAIKFLGTKSIKTRTKKLRDKILRVDHLAKQGVFRTMQEV